MTIISLLPIGWKESNYSECPICKHDKIFTTCEDRGQGFNIDSNEPHQYRNRILCANCGYIINEIHSPNWYT